MKFLSLMLAVGMLSACTITIYDGPTESKTESQVSESVPAPTSEGSSEQTSQQTESGSQTQSDTESTSESQEPTSQSSEESTTPQQSEESQEPESVTPDEDPDFVTEGNEYKLVTNLKTQLHVGYRYIIGAQSNDNWVFMSNEQNDDYRPVVSGTVTNNSIELTGDILNLELEQDEEEDYYFKVLNYGSSSASYLSGDTLDQNQLHITSETTDAGFSIELNDEHEALINCVSENVSRTTMMYNLGATRISLYGSTSNQRPVYLFRGSKTSEADPIVIDKIAVKGDLTKKAYYVNDQISLQGLYVEATYVNDAKEPTTIANATLIPTPSKAPATPGNSKVSVIATYLDYVSDAVEFDIEVSERDTEGNSNYELITSTDDLEVGANYIFATAKTEEARFLSTSTNTSNAKFTTSTYAIEDNQVLYRDDIQVHTLGKVSGDYTFITSEDKYLTATSSTSSNNLKYTATLDDFCKFSISFGSDGNVVITCTGKTSRNVLQANTSASVFAFYTSGQGNVYLFKEVDMDPDDSWDHITITGTPTKLDYYTEDTAWDPTGLTVKAVSQKSVEKEVTANVNWTYNPATIPAVETLNLSLKITATYKGISEHTNVVVNVTVKPAEAGTKDVLDKAFTGVSNSYEEWTNTGTSGAAYKGKSAGNNNSIQLRASSDNKDSGIVVTTSAGKVAKVVVVWESHTQTDRTLNIYGKNDPYISPTELFNEASQGTLLGTIVCETSTELTITGDYAYIGLRSNKDAMYLSSITITWVDA